MKVEFRMDPNASEPYAVVYARERDAEVDALIESMSGAHTIEAYSERGKVLLRRAEVQRIYTQQRRVLVEADGGTFFIRERLYALEEKLDGNEFVRISNSEIVNKRRIKKLDFSITGTIRLTFRDGTETYVSRRYVPRIRSLFERGKK